MQFTPQQLAGGHKYSAKTKVGNWYEDALLEEAKYADFQRTYTSGTLALRKQEEKKARCLKHVSAPVFAALRCFASSDDAGLRLSACCMWCA